MNKKQRKTLAAIFAEPTASGLRFSDIERLLIALGGELDEGEGSRIAITFRDARIHLHRPHPGKEAKKYQIEDVRAFLDRLEIRP